MAENDQFLMAFYSHQTLDPTKLDPFERFCYGCIIFFLIDSVAVHILVCGYLPSPKENHSAGLRLRNTAVSRINTIIGKLGQTRRTLETIENETLFINFSNLSSLKNSASVLLYLILKSSS